MTAFLERLSAIVVNEFTEPNEVTIVLPSRRAGVYLRKCLSSKINRPCLAPRIFSIDDYIGSLSPYVKAGRLELLADLYKVYTEYFPSDMTESFERFYPWGEMMIEDFDEIDKNLVDSAKIFRYVSAEKEIQQEFEIDIDSEYFRKFWNNFSNLKPHFLKQDFLKLWQVLGKIYSEYRSILMNKKRVYAGISYRKVYELVTSDQIISEGNVIFCGFNFLTRSEEGIIRHLLMQGKARVYWDADSYYLHNGNHEAGAFIRKNIENLKISQPLWIEDLLQRQPKNIKVISAPLVAAQVKFAGDIIKEIPQDQLKETVVVLPDESILLPFLCSLPHSVNDVNVTMGYPLKHSKIFSLFESVRRLHKNKTEKGFYFSDITEILSHPYTGNSPDNKLITNDINSRNLVYISTEKILMDYVNIPSIVKNILTHPEKTGIYDYLCQIIKDIDENFRTENSDTDRMHDYALLNKTVSVLSELNNTITERDLELSFDFYMQFLLDTLSGEHIPLEGEHFKGLQVMGMLETRALSFRNVIILSMNEGTMPRNVRKASFIPFNLRKAFGLSTYDDDDAVSAYMFYRLIQRAENIILIYKTAEEGLSPSEKSRYIMQIENELLKLNPDISYSVLHYTPDIIFSDRNEISVLKNDKVLQEMKSVKYFSPSSISIYINCPLQFYLQYIAGLEKVQTAEEVLSGAGFGNILHGIMEDLYKDYKGREIDGETIESIMNNFCNTFDELWKAACRKYIELKEFSEHLSGRNLLLKSVIRKLILKILDNDIRNAPFRIIDLEKKIEMDYRISDELNVKFKGRLDRIEEKDGVVRIIDYKTGRIDSKATGSISELTLLFNSPDLKEAFQQYFYLYLYHKIFPESKAKIGLYNIIDYNSGIKFIDNDSLSDERLEEFGKGLENLISEMFNKDIPFCQTKDENRCTYCDFRSLCYRD